jgi:hypothetical protein
MDASGRIYYVKVSDKSISWQHPDDITTIDQTFPSSEGGFIAALHRNPRTGLQEHFETESSAQAVKHGDENAHDGTRRLQYGAGA